MDTNFVSTLLSELMTEYNRVSLPCLGSFLGQYAPARLSDDGTMMLPPSKRIDFHQNEIWNDEKLEKLIAHRQRISLGKAKEMVAFWIDDICLSLSSGKEVELDGLGKFSVNTDNKLIFEQQLSQNLLLESFGLEAVVLPVRKKAIQPIAPAVRPSADFITKLEKKKKKKKTFVLQIILLLVCLIIGTTAGLLYFEIVPVPTFIRSNNHVVQSIIPSANEQQETTPPSVVTPPIEEVFRIRLGTYTHYNEARAHVKQMEQNGFKTMIFYIAGDIPYHVCLGIYDTQTAAQVVLDNLSKKDSLHLFEAAKIELVPLEGELGL